MTDIRNKIGVGFLKRAAAGADRRQHAQAFGADRFLNEAVVLFTNRFLQALARLPAKEAQVLDIARSQDIPISDALRVADYLKEKQHVTVVSEDPIGNDRIALTPAGEDFLKRAGLI